jgi:hypothetical protein
MREDSSSGLRLILFFQILNLGGLTLDLDPTQRESLGERDPGGFWRASKIYRSFLTRNPWKTMYDLV